MRPGRRIAAYGLCRDAAGRVLLVRGAQSCDAPGVWQLPGGGLRHGEDPADAVVRELREETGLAVAVGGVRDVLADVLEVPWRGLLLHTDRIIYELAVRGGTLRAEAGGTTDRAAWLTVAEAAAVPLMPFTAELLGLPADLDALRRDVAARIAARPDPPSPPSPAAPVALAAPAAPQGPHGQRFGAYGLVTDPAGRVLLTLIADNYPGGGRWHLPGGGTDHGEQPRAAFLRELAEEAGQLGRVTGLLDVSHRHNPRALGPEGHPVDWHVVRVVYRARVDAPTEPRVTEAAGGSTAAAGWFTPRAAADLPLTEIAAAALRSLAGEPPTGVDARGGYTRGTVEQG